MTHPDRPLQARLDAVIDSAVNGGDGGDAAMPRIVGGVVLVARDGAPVYRRAFGLADREDGRPMREDTPFRLASLTKPVVAAAAMALVERGVLDLQAPVTRFLPDFRPRLADGSTPEITIRHLMTHSSGLGYRFIEKGEGPYTAADVSDGLDQPGLPLAENLRRIASIPLFFAPGEAWLYSLGIDVLGAAMAAASGAPLPQIVEETVTGPLGLSTLRFLAPDPSALATPYADGVPDPVRMSDPHVLDFADGQVVFAPSRAGDAAAYASGGGGMVGTAPEFLAFLEVLRRGGAPILRPDSAAALTTDAIAPLELPESPGWGFGLGAAVLRDPGPMDTPQAPGTFRWGGIYGHSWFVDPAARLSVVALTNTAVAGVSGTFPDAIRDAVYGRH